MYRKIFTFLFLLTSINIAQSLKVIKTEKLISGGMERLFFPKISPDGSSILLTKNNFQGLWLFNITDKKLKQINDYNGSGFKAKFDEKGNIKFDIEEYIDKIRTIYSRAFNLTEEIEFDDTLKSNLKLDVRSNNKNIRIIRNGKNKFIKPMGDGSYIWVSLSPKGDRILFTVLGTGTYICDLEGRITSKLGYANACKWSPDGNWIAFMYDTDDGLRYISSDIYIISADGKIKFNLTNTKDEIEMYPEWSPGGNKIVYHNPSGEIFITEFNIQ